MKNRIFKFLSMVLCCAVCLSTGCQSGGSSSSSGNEQKTNIEIADTNILLCANGVSDYKIIIPNEHTSVIRVAANELSAFLLQATGAEIVIEKDTGNYSADSKLISLGKTSAFNNANISIDEKELGRDGFKIERKDDDVYICGGSDFGTAFGCYGFLEHEINFEAYAEDEIYFEKKDTLKLKDFNFKDIPDFETRTTDGVVRYEPYTAFRLRLLSDYAVHTIPEFNNGLESEWIPTTDHSLRKILKYQEYGKEHPEWFVNGDVVNAQLCLTNDDMVVAFISELKDLILEKPNGNKVSIQQQDGMGWCQCENCKNEVAKYNFSGYYVRFVNRIITGFTYVKDGETVEVEGIESWIQRTDPQRELTYVMFAYQDTLAAPTTDDGQVLDESCIPHKKVSIRLAISNTCWAHDFHDENCSTNLKTEAALLNWQRIAQNFMIWDYAANYYNYMQFFNDYHTFKTNLLRYKEMGAVHLFKQFASGTNVYPFANMRTYLFGKLSWDLDQDMESLIEAFMAQYYKDAAPYIREYFDFIISYWAVHDAEVGHNFHANNSTSASVDAWPRNIVEKSLAIMDQALEAAKNMADKELGTVVYKRVLEEKFCIEMQKLTNYSAYGYSQDDYSAYVAYVKQMALDTGARSYAEFTHMSDLLKNY